MIRTLITGALLIGGSAFLAGCGEGADAPPLGNVTTAPAVPGDAPTGTTTAPATPDTAPTGTSTAPARTATTGTTARTDPAPARTPGRTPPTRTGATAPTRDTSPEQARTVTFTTPDSAAEATPPASANPDGGQVGGILLRTTLPPALARTPTTAGPVTGAITLRWERQARRDTQGTTLAQLRWDDLTAARTDGRWVIRARGIPVIYVASLPGTPPTEVWRITRDGAADARRSQPPSAPPLEADAPLMPVGSPGR